MWAPGQAGLVLDAVHDQAIRCVVVDLGSLPTREEQSLVAGAVLGELWRRRQVRRPVLIVIDEADNICPADPGDLLAERTAELAIRITAEGPPCSASAGGSPRKAAVTCPQHGPTPTPESNTSRPDPSHPASLWPTR